MGRRVARTGHEATAGPGRAVPCPARRLDAFSPSRRVASFRVGRRTASAGLFLVDARRRRPLVASRRSFADGRRAAGLVFARPEACAPTRTSGDGDGDVRTWRRGRGYARRGTGGAEGGGRAKSADRVATRGSRLAAREGGGAPVAKERSRGEGGGRRRKVEGGRRRKGHAVVSLYQKRVFLVKPTGLRLRPPAIIRGQFVKVKTMRSNRLYRRRQLYPNAL